MPKIRRNTFSGNYGVGGSVGSPGVYGSLVSEEYKEYMFLCKKDFGFFKTGDYITMLMLINENLFGAIPLKSKDSKMNFTITQTQLDEHFMWGPELRDKHISDIINP
jgi:hypothetical protein